MPHWEGWGFHMSQGSGSGTAGGIRQHRITHGHSRPGLSSSLPFGWARAPQFSPVPPLPLASLTPLALSSHTSPSTHLQHPPGP